MKINMFVDYRKMSLEDFAKFIFGLHTIKPPEIDVKKLFEAFDAFAKRFKQERAKNANFDVFIDDDNAKQLTDLAANIFAYRVIADGILYIVGDITDENCASTLAAIIHETKERGAVVSHIQEGYADEDDEDVEPDEEKYKAFMRKMRRIMKD